MPEKALRSMLFKWEPSAKVTVARDLQQRKAKGPMLVTVAGMNTLETLVIVWDGLNAESPMAVTL